MKFRLLSCDSDFRFCIAFDTFVVALTKEIIKQGKMSKTILPFFDKLLTSDITSLLMLPWVTIHFPVFVTAFAVSPFLKTSVV